MYIKLEKLPENWYTKLVKNVYLFSWKILKWYTKEVKNVYQNSKVKIKNDIQN